MTTPDDKRRQRWDRLNHLLTRVERGTLAALTVPEVQQLGRLYRQVSIDLARARIANDNPDLVRYLNNLAARAHGQVYRTRRASLRPALAFLASGFPRLVRRQALAILLAAGVMFGSALASFVAVVHEPRMAYSLFDEQTVEYENIRLEKQQGEYRGNFTFPEQASPMVGAFIIANNILVSIRAFATGALLGLPCLLMLTYNGRMLGTLEGLLYNHGYFRDFNALILTHGVLELSAICIASGGGLLLARAVLMPGNFTRRHALRSVAGDALGLLLGASAMLVVAGCIEAYVTPHFSQPVRWTVAGTSAVLLTLYIAVPGRSPRPATSPAPVKAPG